MLRAIGRARVPLICLMLLVVALGPAVTKGYGRLSHAEVESSSRRFAEAGRDYKGAAHLLFWMPQLWERAGIAYASAGDWQAALPLLERARGLQALSADGWDVLGTGYWLQAENAQARDVWASGLRRFPSELKFHSRLALAYRGLGQSREETQALKTWLEGGSGTSAEHYRLGELLMTSDLGRAQAELAQASAMDERFVPAVRTLQASIDLAGRETSAAARLVLGGRGLGLVEDWALAEQAFKAATEADPRNAQAWAWLGEARQHTGQDGTRELNRAWSLDSRDPLIAGLQALHSRRRGEYVQELGWYQAAAQLAPDNPEWQAGIAEAHAMNGDLVAALQVYQKATELAPDNAAYWRLLAMFCADNAVQVQDVGLPAAKRAASLAPNDPAVLDALGWSYAQAGLLYNAEESLRKAVKLAPEAALAHLHLGETYLRKGDWQSAEAELRAASSLDAEGPVGSLAGNLLQQYFP